jgi:hypothetical protein
MTTTPPLHDFTPDEAALIRRLRTPLLVQRWLRGLRYNAEGGGETLRSFRGVVRAGCAHCFEAALTSAAILEQHGDPPLLLSLASADDLEHVLFLYRRAGRWGAVGRSRDPGLHGRRPVFASVRALAASYLEPFVDYTGRVNGYAVLDLRRLPGDWRFAERNLWRVDRWRIDHPHRPIDLPEARYQELLARYRRYRARFPDRKPTYYDRSAWL